MSNIRAAVIPVTPFEQNCSLFWDDETKEGVLIDPGGDVDRIKTVIDEQGVTVKTILLTHGHIDHAAGADEMREILGVDIVGPHMADKFLMDNLEMQGSQYGIPNSRNVSPDKWLDEGDTVEIAGHTFAVHHCPGHSPGSVAFISEALNFAIVGDVLFAGSVGRTDLPGGDHDTLLKSISEKLFNYSDDMAFICGHGPGSTFGQEKKTNPFLR